MERETGLEPATPCLEGTAPSQRPITTPPRWRKVASDARSRAAIHKAEGRVTVNEPNQGAVYSFAGISCDALPGSLSRVSVRLHRVSHHFRRVPHSSRAVSLRRRQMYQTFLQEGNGMRVIGKKLRQGLRRCDASLGRLESIRRSSLRSTRSARCPALCTRQPIAWIGAAA